MRTTDEPLLKLHPQVAQHRDEVVQLCLKHGVRRLFIVGSSLRPDFHTESSDADLIVEFGPVERHGFRDPYFQLKTDLESVLGRPVDLIEWDAVTNPYLRQSFERTRVMLYAA